MQTPKPCWSFHMNPPLNTSPRWTTKYFSVNKLEDINNIFRAGQQAVQGIRSYTGAASLLADLTGDCEIIVYTVTDQIPESSPSTVISVASKMCPAVPQLGVNYRLTAPLFVVLESGVSAPTLSTRHSRRSLSQTLNTLSKCSKCTPK